MLTLGRKLALLRQAKRISQVEVAEYLGVSENSYNKWESDKMIPKLENLIKIAKFYDVDIKDLYENNEINRVNADKKEIMSVLKKQEQQILNLVSAKQEQFSMISNELIKITENLIIFTNNLYNQQDKVMELLENHFKLVELMNDK